MIDEAALRQAFAELRALVRAQARRIDALEKASGLFVPDEDLDRPRGDPRVKFVPRSWKGADFKGCWFSACSPEFLEVLAETLTWMANNPKEGADPKYAGWNRTDAARARSWARRLRAREVAAYHPEPPAPPTAAPSGPTANVLYDRATGEVLDEEQAQAAAHATLAEFEFQEPSSAGADDFSFPESDAEHDEFQFEESDHG